MGDELVGIFVFEYPVGLAINQAHFEGLLAQGSTPSTQAGGGPGWHKRALSRATEVGSHRIGPLPTLACHPVPCASTGWGHENQSNRLALTNSKNILYAAT